jgi:putative spermidine/putrescine transport system substrate-binding protein
MRAHAQEGALPGGGFAVADHRIDRLAHDYVAGGLSRRQFIKSALALGVSLTSISAFLAACANASPTAAPSAGNVATLTPSTPTPTAAADLNVVAWGGGYGKALKQYVSTPFEAAHGDKVLVQEQSQASASLAKLQAEIPSPTIDVWLTTGALPLQLAQQNGLNELTPDKIANLADVIPALNQTYQGKIYGAGIHLSVRTITVDKSRIKSVMPDYTPDMLNSWEFLWRPELKDQVSLNGFESGVGTAYIGQAMHRGASQTDEEAFFKAMKEIAPNVHVDLGASAGIGELALFQSKEIMVSSNNMNDAQELVKNNVPVDIGYPQDPLITILDYVVSVKGGPAGPDLSFDFINRLLDPTQQTPYEGAIANLPTNKKAAAPTLEGLPPITADTILAKAWSPDLDIALKNYDAWFARYNKEIIPLLGK